MIEKKQESSEWAFEGMINKAATSQKRSKKHDRKFFLYNVSALCP